MAAGVPKKRLLLLTYGARKAFKGEWIAPTETDIFSNKSLVTRVKTGMKRRGNSVERK